MVKSKTRQVGPATAIQKEPDFNFGGVGSEVFAAAATEKHLRLQETNMLQHSGNITFAKGSIDVLASSGNWGFFVLSPDEEKSEKIAVNVVRNSFCSTFETSF